MRIVWQLIEIHLNNFDKFRDFRVNFNDFGKQVI
jgi:hypothetical protein